MVFSGLTFLLLFLPAVLLVYFIVPKRFKNAVLFLFSLLFYAWGEPVYVVLMLFSTVLDFSCGKVVDRYRGTPKAKIGLLVSVFVNLGLLCLFKYTDFFITTINSITGTAIPLLNLPLPIGISFYTFQTMSYTIDVYRGDAKVQNNIISFGAYVSLFPQLIAGPIVRYQTIADQINDRTHSFDKFGDGVKRFAVGLAKKVLLANNIDLLWSAVSKTDISQLSVVSAWLGAIAFAFQIYFDFSGYSDMAIGLGKIFGFDFLENFNYPYISKSVTEFWRRWHISMGTWFRDYVYIPLGGNRKRFAVQIRNIAVVWLLTGFWHGASWNYVLWGVFYGILLIIEKLFLLKYLNKAPSFIGHIYAVICILIGWVFFAFEDISQGLDYLKVMFGGASAFVTNETMYQMISYLPLLLICLVASTPVGKILYGKLKKLKNSTLTSLVSISGMLAVTVLSTAYLISGSYNPFLYFRF